MSNWTTVALMALAGLLLGEAYSLRQQKMPRWTWISCLVLVAMALLAAFLLRS